ncbi:MAG: hypothetical protein QOF14_1291 [Hyphomicrobiales bacterium]|nr:hypothetical protein [Hyphomicrobiales bacterium]
MYDRGGNERGVRADVALSRTLAAVAGRDQAFRARACTGARARGIRRRQGRRWLRGLRVRSDHTGRAREGGGRHGCRRAADAPAPRPSARDDAPVDRCCACAWRARRGPAGVRGYALRTVRLRHGIDVSRDRRAARAHGNVYPDRYDVADEFCPWNAGRWRIGRGVIEKTTAEADLACDVSSLGCVYLGGFTFAQLGRSMRVRELRLGAITRADALFHSDRAPWCPEIF